jgi:hypothetical protein
LIKPWLDHVVAWLEPFRRLGVTPRPPAWGDRELLGAVDRRVFHVQASLTAFPPHESF